MKMGNLLKTELKEFKKCAAVVIIAVVMLTANGCSETMATLTDVPKEEINAVHSTVRILAGEEIGAGVIVKDSERKSLTFMTILTAGHVIEGVGTGAEVLVSFADGKEAAGSVETVFDEQGYDIGIVTVSYSDVPKKTLDFIFASEIVKGEDAYNPKEFKIFDLSAGNGRYTSITGSVESMNEYFYEFDKVLIRGKAEGISEGMSGSPLFDSRGELFGILVAGNDDGTVAAENLVGKDIF